MNICGVGETVFPRTNFIVIMDWLSNLFFCSGIAHCVVILAIVIAIGIALGKLKFRGLSLGVTWVLFVGIAFGHFKMQIDSSIMHFARDFGLILFVYSIGLQVGPGFFSSFKKAGLKLNAVALSFIFMSVIVTICIARIFKMPMETMVGIMSGAVTNTPGLGAATQTYIDITGKEAPSISLGYAVAYPLGVIGVISAMIIIKSLFGIKSNKDLDVEEEEDNVVNRMSIKIRNPSIAGKKIEEIVALSNRHFVISRVNKGDSIEIASLDTRLEIGDNILVISDKADIDFIVSYLGERIDMEWKAIELGLEARRILITNHNVNGKTIGKLGLFGRFAFNITRVNRAGIDLVAHPDLSLQVGDRVTIVGETKAIANVEKMLGNSMMKLRQPNLVPIFLGIFLGVVLGSIPIFLPGIPQPVKLGLAGGPLVVAILLSRFGSRINMVTYTTVSASLMLREVGIALFLACVGLGAGGEFISTIIDGGGYKWIGYGFAITIIPTLTVGIIARLFLKLDYFKLIGVMSGGTTNPPALAYANSLSGNDIPSVAYATVYPLSMFMRVVSAQLLIIFFI